MEYQRGMKTMTLPAHRYEGCRDIQVKCIQFVVPEDISENGEPEHAMCAPRKFKVRFIAHTIDTDYRCCEAVIDLQQAPPVFRWKRGKGWKTPPHEKSGRPGRGVRFSGWRQRSKNRVRRISMARTGHISWQQ